MSNVKAIVNDMYNINDINSFIACHMQKETLAQYSIHRENLEMRL